MTRIKRAFLAVAVASVVLAGYLLLFSRAANDYDYPMAPEEPQTETVQTQSTEQLQHSLDELDSIWLVVNKNRPVPLDYIPVDLVDVNVTKREDKSPDELQLRQEAAIALEALFAAARNDGYDLLLGSAYRSPELQSLYYNNYVAAYGQEEADMFSAKPGTSEHQIGLAADVSGVDRVCYLEICFDDTLEGQWVAENAHIYGFIVRYPLGKEAITGYQYEPWHLRYVGTELAIKLHDSAQTLEEYFSL